MTMQQAPGLGELLDRFEAEDEMRKVSTVYDGKAIGKTRDSLHLAIADGVLAIPFSEIDAVAPASYVSPDAVYVAVRNPDAVSQIVTVRVRPELIPNPDDPGAPVPDPFGILNTRPKIPWQLLDPVAGVATTSPEGEGVDTLSPSGQPIVGDDVLDHVKSWIIDDEED